jgi:hypothetical protein
VVDGLDFLVLRLLLRGGGGIRLLIALGGRPLREGDRPARNRQQPGDQQSRSHTPPRQQRHHHSLTD